MSRGPDPFMMFEAPKIAPRLPAPSGSFNADPWNALSNDFLRPAKHRTLSGVKLAKPEKMVMEFAGKPRPLPRISASAKQYFDNGWDDDAVDSDSDDGSAGGDGGEGGDSGEEDERGEGEDGSISESKGGEERRPGWMPEGGRDTRAVISSVESLINDILVAHVEVNDYEEDHKGSEETDWYKAGLARLKEKVDNLTRELHDARARAAPGGAAAAAAAVAVGEEIPLDAAAAAKEAARRAARESDMKIAVPFW